MNKIYDSSSFRPSENSINLGDTSSVDLNSNKSSSKKRIKKSKSEKIRLVKPAAMESEEEL